MNKEAVASYLMIRMYPKTNGIFGGRQFNPLPKLDFDQESQYSEKHYLELLKTSVKRCVEDLTEVSVPLSGGLDSSSIVWAIKEVAPDIDIHTFSVSFPNTGENDEAEYAKMVAEYLGTKHRSLYIQNVMHGHEKLVTDLGEPKWTLYTKKAYDMANTDVIISGLGGDEIFAGYAWKYDFMKRWHARSIWAKETMWLAANNYGAPVEVLGAELWKYRNIFPLIYPWFSNNTIQYEEAFRRCDLEAKGVWDFMYTDYLIAIKYQFDIRYPFLNPELMQYGIGLPTYLLVREGLGKTIMRNAMIGKLPEEIVLRRKIGFGPNLIDLWENELLPICESVNLEDGVAVDRRYLNPEYIHFHMSRDRISADYLHHYKAMAQALSLEYLMRNIEAEW